VQLNYLWIVLLFGLRIPFLIETLKTADWLDVAKYPQASFLAQGVSKNLGGNYSTSGKLK